MTWQGFTAGFIAALVMMLMVRAALWVATSRKISDADWDCAIDDAIRRYPVVNGSLARRPYDAMEAENGDWPHMGGR